MFKLPKLFGAHAKLERLWADTEVAAPETVIQYDESDRSIAAESEWFTDSLNAPGAPVHKG